MHLQRLGKAGVVKSEMELSDAGKAMKYYELVHLACQIDQNMINEAVRTLTIKKGRKKRMKTQFSDWQVWVSRC